MFHRLLQRYGNPSRKPDGPLANELQGFARHFQDHLSSPCLQACLGLLSRRHAGLRLPGRVVTLALNYVEESIKYKLTYSQLKPQLSTLK